MADELGNALTGGQVDPAVANQQWDAWLERPGNRTALLQFGLQMMQPVAIGQTAGGHIAQSVGAAGEATGRAGDADLKERQVDMKEEASKQRLDIANRRLEIAQQNANTAEQRATGRKVGGLTELMQKRFEREDAKAAEKQLFDDAYARVDQVDKAEKAAKDIMNPVPFPKELERYRGKAAPDIREMLRAERSAGASAPAADPAAEDSPPVEGARKAADGNWYKPDPARPGKYLRVTR